MMKQVSLPLAGGFALNPVARRSAGRRKLGRLRTQAAGVPNGGFRPEFQGGRKREPVDLLKLAEESLEVNERVHIVAFRAEGVERSGLYSLKSLTTPPYVHKVVCFECHDDAQDCAEILAAVMPNPRAESCTTHALVNMCLELGYGCELHLAGSDFEPPKFEELTDWERASRLRQGQFKVMDHEPPVQK